MSEIDERAVEIALGDRRGAYREQTMREGLSALLARGWQLAAPGASVVEWRPIETAPRDGQLVHVTWPGAEFAPLAKWEQAGWLSDDPGWRGTKETDVPYFAWLATDDQIGDDGWFGEHVNGIEPTHWMPLLAPPPKQGGAADE